jgi:hypothetical protein
MESETRAADKVNQERDQLLHQFFEAVNDLFLSYRSDCIRVKTERLVDVKRKITQLDPNWKLANLYNCHVFRILSYLDKLYTEEVNFVANEILGLKISLEIGEM